MLQNITATHPQADALSRAPVFALRQPEDQKWQPQELALSPAAKFDWSNKWLKGDEYHHILSHADLYTEVFQFKKFPQKSHPRSIYLEPQSIALTIYTNLLVDGLIYFVEGLSVGSEFGFPRLTIKKKYKW